MRRISVTAKLLVALLAAMLILLATALSEAYPCQMVTTCAANLRQAASPTAMVRLQVPAGATVTVSGEVGSYSIVMYEGQSGFILTGYLASPGAAAAGGYSAPQTNNTVTGYPYTTTTSDSVNMRQKPSSSAKLLRRLSKGDTITVTGVEGDFACVTYAGQTGYVMTQFIHMKTIVSPTPAPTVLVMDYETLVSAENASEYMVLQLGSQGEDVRALQSALTELGFYKGTITGRFDTATRDAVVAFQSKNRYPDTGIVDANLQAFLYSGKPKNKQGVATKVKTLAPVDGVIARKGSMGDLVSRIQQQLKDLGYYKGAISGKYDTATYDAVVKFQKKNGLKADGTSGSQTQAMLFGGTAYHAEAATPSPTPKPTRTPRPTATPKPTATPTPLPRITAPNEGVSRGSTGTAARQVQQRLKELGYLSGAVDGQFGSASVSALTAFQAMNGLTADGIAGSGTYAVLFSWNAIRADGSPVLTTPEPVVVTPVPTQAPTPVPTATPLTRENVTVVAQGVSGSAVLSVQQRLTELRYYTASMDGVCRAEDAAAIRAFQQRNGLTADGVAGYDTQIVLFGTNAIANTLVTTSYQTLRMGDTGASVTRLQNRLMDLGYLYGTPDGKYGSVTAEAVTNFQRANGLVRDGVAGVSTQELLYSSAAISAAVATPAPTVSMEQLPIDVKEGTVLTQGSSGEAVRRMQTTLISLGYLSGTADGKFGLKTANALREFQRANFLTVDGKAGSGTIAALNAAMATPVPTPAPSADANVTPAPTNTVQPNAVPDASQVIYANWYSKVRAVVRIYQYATVYDYQTGASWQVHMFSFGNHAEAEPVTAYDTAKMEADFGGNTWTPKPVWVILGNGQVYMATMHDMPHEVQHITDNNFAGHLCIHFPRTRAQVAAIGPYATSHQEAVEEAWAQLQASMK